MNRAQRLALASVLTALIAISGPWLLPRLGQALPFYKNPVDLTWAGFAFIVLVTALAPASMGLGVEARRLSGREGKWSAVGGAGVLLGFLAIGLYVLWWFGAFFVEVLPWQHPL